MSVECIQAHMLMLHVIPKQERVGTIGDGVNRGPRHEISDFGMGLKIGVPTYGGAWGRKCSNEGVACPHLNIFAPSPFVPDKTITL